MTSPTAPLPSFRHPGLDPESIHSAPREWIPDQVRDDDGWGSLAKIRIASEVAQFYVTFGTAPFPLSRHPRLDPKSPLATVKSGTPDQVRGDEIWAIQCEVAQISGLPA